MDKGEWADTDRCQPRALQVYETLVLRRSPEQSRPPGNYRLIYAGDYYEVWQRKDRPRVVAHLPLGNGLNPSTVPKCDRVREIAGRGRMLAAPPAPTVVVDPRSGSLPDAWTPAGSRGFVLDGSAQASFPIVIHRAGDYSVWVAGSVQGELEASIDGIEVGDARQLNNAGLYIGLGAADLEPGKHTLTLDYEADLLDPGSGGPPPPRSGPLSYRPRRKQMA